MKKIGYMGIPLSNSEKAAQVIAGKRKIDAELVPLVSSEGVVRAILSGSIDYGVVAVRNMVAGPVLETEKAMKLGNVRNVEEFSMPIHHCVFIKRKGAKISAVASHVQALGQTYRNISRLFPGVDRLEVEDTALAAEMLADGRLPEDTAVICGMAAGLHYGLVLLKDNVEDDPDNLTDFALLESC
ncbi:MAG: prephenate dehydratase [Candidatus Methanomethylophilaceae archaeon]|nr:prephenate dehydratase [Candidatus Methanomethylophilaceae archaeon]